MSVVEGSTARSFDHRTARLLEKKKMGYAFCIAHIVSLWDRGNLSDQSQLPHLEEISRLHPNDIHATRHQLPYSIPPIPPSVKLAIMPPLLSIFITNDNDVFFLVQK